MSASDFRAKITKAELSAASPALARLEMQRCDSEGFPDGNFGALCLDIPLHRLGEFVPGSIVTVSIHPAAVAKVSA